MGGTVASKLRQKTSFKKPKSPIQLAGEVKARGDRRRARSDWMVVERERGISVSSAVMSFEHQGLAFNLLEAPGHQDFSPSEFQQGHLPRADRGRQRGSAPDNDLRIARFVSYSVVD